MVEPSVKKEAIRSYLELNVPSALSGASLLAIDEFVSKPISDFDSRICIVFNPSGTFDYNSTGDLFAVRFQLPGESEPEKYNDVIYPIVRNFDPSSVGATELSVAYGNTYPFETENGQTGYCEYVIDLISQIDDCEGE